MENIIDASSKYQIFPYRQRYLEFLKPENSQSNRPRALENC